MDKNAQQFSRVGVVATMVNAVHIRDDFNAWIAQFLLLDAEKSSDIILAVNEALANSAEHAYLDVEPGLMHVQADYDPQLSTLTVSVADEGSWRVKDPSLAPNPGRGRGSMLMRALADRVVVDSTSAGTEVRLQWDHIRGHRDDPASRTEDDDRMLA